jgi:uncharacterized protein (TIGR03067 family)
MSTATRQRALVPAVLVLLVLRVGAHQAPNDTELEGTWEAVESAAGDLTRTFKPGDVRLTFRGQLLRAVGLVEPRRQEQQIKFRLDATANPKQFDYERAPGQMALCIYEVVGNRLRIAVPRRNPNERSSNFDPKTSPITLLILEQKSTR